MGISELFVLAYKDAKERKDRGAKPPAWMAESELTIEVMEIIIAGMVTGSKLSPAPSSP